MGCALKSGLPWPCYALCRGDFWYLIFVIWLICVNIVFCFSLYKCHTSWQWCYCEIPAAALVGNAQRKEMKQTEQRREKQPICSFASAAAWASWNIIHQFQHLTITSLPVIFLSRMIVFEWSLPILPRPTYALVFGAFDWEGCWVQKKSLRVSTVNVMGVLT